MKRSSVDLTTGSIYRQIITLAIPILMGEVLQNLYNSADALVAGNFAGTTALAAVSLCNDIARFLQAINQNFSFAVRGYGNTRAVMMLSVLGIIGCRQIYLAYIARYNPSFADVALGYPVGWGASAFFVALYFYFAVYRQVYQQKQ